VNQTDKSLGTKISLNYIAKYGFENSIRKASRGKFTTRIIRILPIRGRGACRPAPFPPLQRIQPRQRGGNRPESVTGNRTGDRHQMNASNSGGPHFSLIISNGYLRVYRSLCDCKTFDDVFATTQHIKTKIPVYQTFTEHSPSKPYPHFSAFPGTSLGGSGG